jgi:hypothetical protein
MRNIKPNGGLTREIRQVYIKIFMLHKFENLGEISRCKHSIDYSYKVFVL